ncbi:MAG: hypothetical protein IPQ03_08650 [Bacteroidetes bacterium]|nr:hypothetical protein [Bacteroidota bacterium]
MAFNSIGFNPPWSLEWMLNGSTFFSNNDTITTSGSGVYSAVAIDVNGCRVRVPSVRCLLGYCVGGRFGFLPFVVESVLLS